MKENKAEMERVREMVWGHRKEHSCTGNTKKEERSRWRQRGG